MTVAYPPTRRDPVTDELFGVAVPDPYRWLEDADAPETVAWVKAQSELTANALAGPIRDRLRARLGEVYDYRRAYLPHRFGAGWFRIQNDGLQPHSVLVRSDAPMGTGRVVLDPNTLSDDGSASLASWTISEDERWLAYAVSDGGSDWHTVRIRDLTTGADLADTVRWVKFFRAELVGDGTALVYARFPAPDAASDPAPNRDQSLWVHRIGDDVANDTLLLAFPDAPDRMIAPAAVDGGRLLAIAVMPSSGKTNGLYVADAGLPGDPAAIGPIRRLVDRFDAQFEAIDRVGRELWLATDLDAPLGRILAVDLDAAAHGPGAGPASGAPLPPGWREVVPEGPDTLASASRVGDKLFVRYLHHACARVAVHDLASGAHRFDVALPGPGTADGFRGRPGDDATHFLFSSHVSPFTVYRCALADGAVTEVFAPTTPFDRSDLHSELVFATSADGTRIPAFVCWKGELVRDGARPTLLYGYGGFNVPMVPSFDTGLVPWLELGGVYVVAVLRGGGEYGRDWHEAGTLARKQNVFDDFAAVAEHLVATGITRAARLAVHGHSNGGLLVGASLVQRPDLFGAAVASVGVFDMLRYHRWTIGRAWASDYGTAEDPALLPVLLGYSPVHNARPAAYPPTLIVTADHDDRVVPAHSFKFGAALQHAQQGEAPVLLRIERQVGHGPGNLHKMLDERADIYAFLVEALGIGIHEDPR